MQECTLLKTILDKRFHSLFSNVVGFEWAVLAKVFLTPSTQDDSRNRAQTYLAGEFGDISIFF